MADVALSIRVLTVGKELVLFPVPNVKRVLEDFDCECATRGTVAVLNNRVVEKALKFNPMPGLPSRVTNLARRWSADTTNTELRLKIPVPVGNISAIATHWIAIRREATQGVDSFLSGWAVQVRS